MNGLNNRSRALPVLFLAFALTAGGCLETGTAREHFINGETLAEKREFKKAISAYSKAIRLDPEFMEAYLHRGAVYCILGKYKKSMADYEKALALIPEDDWVKRLSVDLIVQNCRSEMKDK